MEAPYGRTAGYRWLSIDPHYGAQVVSEVDIT